MYNSQNPQYNQGGYNQTNRYPNYGQRGQMGPQQQNFNTMGQQQQGQIPIQQNFSQL